MPVSATLSRSLVSSVIYTTLSYPALLDVYRCRYVYEEEVSCGSVRRWILGGEVGDPFGLGNGVRPGTVFQVPSTGPSHEGTPGPSSLSASTLHRGYV